MDGMLNTHAVQVPTDNKKTGGITMFDLRPYSRRNVSVYDPFADLYDVEKKFHRSCFGSDIKETDTEFVIETDLPGFRKEDIILEANGDILSIKATRKSEYEKKDEKNKVIRSERSFGTYERHFDISGIDASALKAKYEDGVLTLTLPKKTQPEETVKRFLIE